MFSSPDLSLQLTHFPFPARWAAACLVTSYLWQVHLIVNNSICNIDWRLADLQQWSAQRGYIHLELPIICVLDAIQSISDVHLQRESGLSYYGYMPVWYLACEKEASCSIAGIYRDNLWFLLTCQVWSRFWYKPFLQGEMCTSDGWSTLRLTFKEFVISEAIRPIWDAIAFLSQPTLLRGSRCWSNRSIKAFWSSFKAISSTVGVPAIVSIAKDELFS